MKPPRSSLLRRSSRFGCEGWKLRGILRNSLKPLPDPPSPRLRRVLLAFIPEAAYSTEAVVSAAKAGSYGIFGERESSEQASPWKDAYSGLRFANNF